MTQATTAERPAIGTLAWARRTGGRLSTSEKLAQVAAAVVLQIRVLPNQLRWKLGLQRDTALAIDPADIIAPDSAIAASAEARCREVSAGFLFNHCLRSYLWGRILAAQRHIKLDDELFYVAALLHDLGLTDRYARGAECFAIRGAEAAAELAATADWSTDRRDRLAEAITLHLNVAVELAHGAEAHLLNAATALDVTGLRYWEIPARTAEAVVQQVPRLAMKKNVWPVWKADADAHPACRGHFLSRYLQFGSRIRSAPFSE